MQVDINNITSISTVDGKEYSKYNWGSLEPEYLLTIIDEEFQGIKGYLLEKKYLQKEMQDMDSTVFITYAGIASITIGK